MSDILDHGLVEDIKRVANLLGTKILSRSKYLSLGKYSMYQIYDGGRTWEELCQKAGITTKKKESVPDEVYFERLQQAVSEMGRLPKTTERKKFGLNFSKRRFPTLNAFIEKAIQIGKLDKVYSSEISMPSPQFAVPASSQTENIATIELKSHRQVPPIPKNTRRNKWERTGINGFPYAPQDELGVVALFAILCSSGFINWSILELRGGKGIDATCFDHDRQTEIRVELKHKLSCSNWNHKIDEIDYIVCWENRWKDFPKSVIELKEIVQSKILK